jgi:exodeoxyribonuclease VII small subunit
MSPKSKKVTFEAGLEQLEKIVEHLEHGELTLEEMLKDFETGVGLIRTCESHLSAAEGKLKELLRGENGELIEKVLGPTLTSFLDGDQCDE